MVRPGTNKQKDNRKTQFPLGIDLGRFRRRGSLRGWHAHFCKKPSGISISYDRRWLTTAYIGQWILLYECNNCIRRLAHTMQEVGNDRLKKFIREIMGFTMENKCANSSSKARYWLVIKNSWITRYEVQIRWAAGDGSGRSNNHQVWSKSTEMRS